MMDWVFDGLGFRGSGCNVRAGPTRKIRIGPLCNIRAGSTFSDTRSGPTCSEIRAVPTRNEIRAGRTHESSPIRKIRVEKERKKWHCETFYFCRLALLGNTSVMEFVTYF